MEVPLAQHVHAVMIDDDLVFLDIDADAYFCLPLQPGLASLDGRRLRTGDTRLAEELVLAGLARNSDAETLAVREQPQRPVRTARRLLELLPHIRPQVRARHLAALGAAIRAGLASKRQTFRQLVEPAARPDTAPPELASLLADLAVWRRLVPWLPMDGVCLFRSGMLAAFLRALGHQPTWVFGVRTWPFQAHCWLQADDVALDDEAERLSAFAPIFGV